eukprot:TRINITY_DN4181_c0_g1_i2.p1 TRINITY_DN4181_c0_g1~~TRINITY_DN4181_c0_g1_i2.p1  ORF type:complete len:148 (+),score=1.19 TRINITY_DN4181_c0_g1_i2:379-822(+)
MSFFICSVFLFCFSFFGNEISFFLSSSFLKEVSFVGEGGPASSRLRGLKRERRPLPSIAVLLCCSYALCLFLFVPFFCFVFLSFFFGNEISFFLSSSFLKEVSFFLGGGLASSRISVRIEKGTQAVVSFFFFFFIYSFFFWLLLFSS